jgi:hypothetical protein
VEGQLVSSKFVRQAMDAFRQKFSTPKNDVVFVMASDDSKWCAEMFSNDTDVYLVSTLASKLSPKQPTFDLAVLTNCNHSIIRFGVFFWDSRKLDKTLKTNFKLII